MSYRDAAGRFLPGNPSKWIPRVEPRPDRLKQCRGGCGEWLPIDCFSRDRTHPDGRDNRCKACRTEYRRKRGEW